MNCNFLGDKKKISKQTSTKKFKNCCNGRTGKCENYSHVLCEKKFKWMVLEIKKMIVKLSQGD